jgi:hypothetical protein
MMKKTVILIDYENIQNVDLKLLLGRDVLIKVFHNVSQKFSSSFTSLAIEFGKERIELIQISGSGKNAADFHIAYVLGVLAGKMVNPSFQIISKDSGFGPLVDFIKNHDHIDCLQAARISGILCSENNGGNSNKDHYSAVVESLSNPKSPKPKKVASLRNQIVSICHKKITEEQVEEIIGKLVDEKLITRKNDSIAYPEV